MSTAQRIFETVKALPADRQREVLDFVEFLHQRSGEDRQAPAGAFDLKPMKLPGWPNECTFRREDLYDDDGR